MFSLLLILSISISIASAAPQPGEIPSLVNDDVRYHDAPLGPDGTVIDTPEVVAAKQQHFAAYDDVSETLSRLRYHDRLQNTGEADENVHNQASNIFSLVTPERFNVAHNTRPEVNNLNEDIIVVQPERFNVAHNVRPEEGRLTVKETSIEEDAVDKFVSGLNLLNVGRLNSLMQRDKEQNKIYNTIINPHFMEVLKTSLAANDKLIHVEMPVEEITSVGHGFIEDSLDVVKAKSEHLAAHAEQVSIHEALHRAAMKSEEETNKDKYLAELDRKISDLKDGLKSKEEIVVHGEGFIRDSSDVAKNLAVQAKHVAIHNAAINSNEDIMNEHRPNVETNVEVNAQGYIQDSEDVAKAKEEHLALHADQVAFHNAAVKAANAIEDKMVSLNILPNDLINVPISKKVSEIALGEIEKKLNDNGRDFENLESVLSILNLAPDNLGIVISLDAHQDESDFENLSSENQTQAVLVVHEDYIYPNVNIEINLNEKYLKLCPGASYIENSTKKSVIVNNEQIDPEHVKKDSDGKCSQKKNDGNSVIYFANPVSVSVQGGLLSNPEKNYIEIADFIHHYKHESLENDKRKDSLKFFTP